MRKTLIALLLILAAPAALQAQLELTDFVLPAGREAIVLALFTSGGNRQEPFREGNTGSFVEGDRVIGPAGGVTDTLTINRIRIQGINATDLVLNRSGSGSFQAYFHDLDLSPVTAVYQDYQWTIQTATTIKTWDQTAQRGPGGTPLGNGGIGGGFARLDDTNDDLALSVPLATSGARFILAITVPAAPTDNCNLYLGTVDFAAPGTFRVGGVTPVRFYLGSNLVCGDAP